MIPQQRSEHRARGEADLGERLAALALQTHAMNTPELSADVGRELQKWEGATGATGFAPQ